MKAEVVCPVVNPTRLVIYCSVFPMTSNIKGLSLLFFLHRPLPESTRSPRSTLHTASYSTIRSFTRRGRSQAYPRCPAGFFDPPSPRSTSITGAPRVNQVLSAIHCPPFSAIFPPLPTIAHYCPPFPPLPVISHHFPPFPAISRHCPPLSTIVRHCLPLSAIVCPCLITHLFLGAFKIHHTILLKLSYVRFNLALRY